MSFYSSYWVRVHVLGTEDVEMSEFLVELLVWWRNPESGCTFQACLLLWKECDDGGRRARKTQTRNHGRFTETSDVKAHN